MEGMTMMRGWILGALAVVMSVGCGSSGSRDVDSSGLSAEVVAGVEGIYELDDLRKNPSACDAPGPSTLASLRDKLFFVASGEVFGQVYLMLASCSSVSDCQNKITALRNSGSYSQEYSYTLNSASNATTMTGFEANTGRGGDNGATCVERTYADHVLTLASNHALDLESRVKHLADRPQEDGFCTVEPTESKAEAESLPCAELEVLDGSFLQAL